MEKQDEKLRGLEAELAGMEAADAVVSRIDPEQEEPGKQCNDKGKQ